MEDQRLISSDVFSILPVETWIFIFEEWIGSIRGVQTLSNTCRYLRSIYIGSFGGPWLWILARLTDIDRLSLLRNLCVDTTLQVSLRSVPSMTLKGKKISYEPIVHQLKYLREVSSQIDIDTVESIFKGSLPLGLSMRIPLSIGAYHAMIEDIEKGRIRQRDSLQYDYRWIAMCFPLSIAKLLVILSANRVQSDAGLLHMLGSEDAKEKFLADMASTLLECLTRFEAMYLGEGTVIPPLVRDIISVLSICLRRTSARRNDWTIIQTLIEQPFTLKICLSRDFWPKPLEIPSPIKLTGARDISSDKTDKREHIGVFNF